MGRRPVGGNLPTQAQRIAEGLRDMWEQKGADILEANAVCGGKPEMSRNEVISIISDFYISLGGNSSSGYGEFDYQQGREDADYLWKLPKTGKVRKAIYEEAFPSRYKTYGS